MKNKIFFTRIGQENLTTNFSEWTEHKIMFLNLSLVGNLCDMNEIRL